MLRRPTKTLLYTRVTIIPNAGRTRVWSEQHKMWVQCDKDPSFRASLHNKVVRVERVDPFNRASFLKLV